MKQVNLRDSPIVKYIILNTILHLKHQRYTREKKQLINTDMIPTTKPQNMHASSFQPMQKQIQPQNQFKNKPLPRRIPKQQMQEPMQIQPRTQSMSKNTEQPKGDYGKLNNLIKDPTITFIECPGPDKPLTLIRKGQRQFTKITLSKKDIQEFINDVSEKAAIPLLEGVFKVAVDNFFLNAVISESIGSRFIIRKQTPYSMLNNNMRKV